MNKLSIYRCSLFISLYVRYYLVSKYSKNFEQYWNDTQVFMCLLLYFKFQSVPSGRPLDLTAENIDPTNKNPSIYYCGRYLDLPTACLHINTPYDCAIQGRGAEVPNHQSLSRLPERRYQLWQCGGRRLEKLPGSLSLSRYCISRLIIV